MAIAAGGLSLVERDRLGFLRQENKASWRKVSLHWPSPSSSPRLAATASPGPSVGKGAGPGGRRGCGSPGSLRLRTCNRCDTTLVKDVWPDAGVLGKPNGTSHLPGGSFPRLGSFTPSPRRSRDQCESGGVLLAAWGILEWLAMHDPTRKELNTDSRVRQETVRTANLRE